VCACCRYKYQKRISRLLLDRIDIHIKVPRVDYEKLSGNRIGKLSESIQKHSSKNGSSDIVCNADMRVGEIRQFCKLQDEGQSLMRAAMTQLNLLARAYSSYPQVAAHHRRPGGE
jgi:magnesium chelatase family protein